MDIADKIKFLRTNILDLSQDKFAKKIDVTRSTINNWEQGLIFSLPFMITMYKQMISSTSDLPQASATSSCSSSSCSSSSSDSSHSHSAGSDSSSSCSSCSSCGGGGD